MCRSCLAQANAWQQASRFSFRQATIVVAIVMVTALSSPAAPTVVNFDDLDAGILLTGTGYAGLTWEYGNLGLSGLPGQWYTPTSGNYPHSLPRNVDNAQGSTLMGIGFPSVVDMEGAYVAIQGNEGATQVRVHGYLGGEQIGVTEWTATLTTTPVWLGLGSLAPVDRIVFESAAVIEGVAGAYGMDDLTFTYVPEPSGLALLALSIAGVLSRRRRTEANLV